MPGADQIADAGRDALALVRAVLADDDLAADTILGHASLRDVASTLAGMAAGLLTLYAERSGWTGSLDELLRAALAAEQEPHIGLGG